MYILKTNASFDSAHFLAGYQGKCRNIHGHRWQVEIQIKGNDLCGDEQNRGMLVDFGKLKEDLKAETSNLDHSLIIEKGSLKEATLLALKSEDFMINEMAFRPTAENLAKYFYKAMEEKGYSVYMATVYETPNNCVMYAGGDDADV